MIQIEKNVPPPKNPTGRKPKYPFGKMALGDSILIQGDERERLNARVASCVYAKRYDMKFQTENTQEGMRIWKTK